MYSSAPKLLEVPTFLDTLYVPADVGTFIYLNVTFSFPPIDAVPLIRGIPHLISAYYVSARYSGSSSNSTSFMETSLITPIQRDFLYSL